MKTLLALICVILVGCAGNAAYKSLYSVGHAVDGSVKGYLDLVVEHKLPTNSVPKVMGIYDKFQGVYKQALKMAQYNLKSTPDTNVMAVAADVFFAVDDAKGMK